MEQHILPKFYLGLKGLDLAQTLHAGSCAGLGATTTAVGARGRRWRHARLERVKDEPYGRRGTTGERGSRRRRRNKARQSTKWRERAAPNKASASPARPSR
ncbi:hypothetical protein EVAR_47415_1 [Eumeta japonica]|uniref:Uncharacterized protein n=1 Tax=Eumeta variegata TaxID=151549 RepID=A0A4C1Y0V5_EUMVA|nr:hypothetical protein EVAR_47415_1 [Eumeta japonica]